MRNVRCCLASALSLVVTDSLISLVRCCCGSSWKGWACRRWPLGVVHPKPPSSGFPAVDKATAAFEESMMFDRAAIEHLVLWISTETTEVFRKHSRRPKMTCAVGCRHVEKWHERAHLVVRKSGSSRLWDAAESLLDLLEYRQPSRGTPWNVWSSPETKDARLFLEFCVRMLSAPSTLFEVNGLFLWYVVSLDGWCSSVLLLV